MLENGLVLEDGCFGSLNLGNCPKVNMHLEGTSCLLGSSMVAMRSSGLEVQSRVEFCCS